MWKRRNGELQVISGRHRFELMMRDDAVQAHLCYVYEEDAEHDEKWARLMDYENNMRDDQADELTAATYVRETGYSDEVLRQKGLMRNASRSKRGALIGREARAELWDRFNNGAIDARDAEIICNLTKNIRNAERIADIQTRCCALLEQGKSWDYIGAMTQLMANKEAVVLKQGLLDLGADFEADLARAATWIEKNLAKINEAINLMKQGRKMSDKKRKEAERLGINVTTAAGSEEMLQLLNDLKAKFEFIGSYPDLVAQATLYDGVSEVDPVGRLLEQAQRDRAEMEEENAMSDEELLEKRNRELAAQEVPSLFQMSGGQMPKMTRKQIERMIDGLKQLSENERTLLKQLVALDNGAEAAVFNSIAMGGAVQLRQGHEKGGLIHMLNRRVETGLTPLEAKLVAIFACFSAAKGEISEIRNGIKYSIDHNGVRAAVAKNSPDSMPVITGFVIDDKGKNAVATGAADSPRTSYALVGLRRDLPVGAALTDVVAWFARFVKTNRDWEAYMVRAVMELKAIQEGKNGMDWTGTTFSMERTDTPQFKKWFGNSVVTSGGKPLPLYHQTANTFTVFDPRRKGGAGEFDSAMPHGIFMKPTADDIGLVGRKQMVLFARIMKPLTFYSRHEMEAYWRSHVPGYNELYARKRDIDADYESRFSVVEAEHRALLSQLRTQRTEGKISKEQFGEMAEKHNEEHLEPLLDEWSAAIDEVSADMREALDEWIADSEYDGLIVKRDVGSFGRVVQTYLALHPNQVKSATDNNGNFDLNNNDITFSMEGERASIKEAAVADGTFMKAPNGKPTKLTERQWLTVRTKAFKAWFGDWEQDPENASQVMDENGEPRVVYHGTPRGGFKVFGDGSFFTPQEWYAERYVDNGGTEKRYGYDGGTPTMYQVFLNIRKPFDTRNNKERKIFERDFFRKWENGTYWC